MSPSPARDPGVAVRLQIWLWRHGWAWPLALSLALVCVVLREAVVLPRQALAASLHLEASRQRLTHRSETPPQAAPSLPEALQAVFGASPPPAEIVARLTVLAERQGVTLPRADYQEQAHPNLPVLQQRITQPVRASYPQLRRYLEAVLRELPNASLDSVTAHRNDVSEGQLEIRLHWSFWRLAALPQVHAPEGQAK